MEVLQIWIAAFWNGWQTIGEIAAAILGGVCATMVFFTVAAVVVLAVAALVAWAFDRITTAMAERWKKTGRRPAGRWADVIARGRKHEE